MNDEIWKPIEGYEGLYEVSNLGRIKSLSGKHRREMILKLRDNGYGYLTIGLSKNNKNKRFKVHRIVAKTFLINNNNYEQVNHMDGDKHNNNVNNLEWCDRSYNMKHAYRNNLLKTRKVIQLDKNGNRLKVWDSIVEASKSTRTYRSNIAKCCKGERNTAGGYKWNYYVNGGDINGTSV